MPFVFLFIGIVFLASGIRGTHTDYTVNGQSYPGLYTLLKGDFSGSNNFLYWIGALGAVGAVGYIPKFKTLSNAFMVLIVIVLILKNGSATGGGLFANFTAALNTSPVGTPDVTGTGTTSTQIANLPATASSAISAPATALDTMGLGLFSGAGGNSGSLNLGNMLGNVLSGSAFAPTPASGTTAPTY